MRLLLFSSLFFSLPVSLSVVPPDQQSSSSFILCPLLALSPSPPLLSVQKGKRKRESCFSWLRSWSWSYSWRRREEARGAGLVAAQAALFAANKLLSWQGEEGEEKRRATSKRERSCWTAAAATKRKERRLTAAAAAAATILITTRRLRFTLRLRSGGPDSSRFFWFVPVM